MEYSIIIPAHNEEATIDRCLQNIRSKHYCKLQVIVVCNGCRDSTANVARQYSSFVEVIETGQASKTKALQIGDDIAEYWPRFYVDADIEIDSHSLRVLATALDDCTTGVAFPVVKTVVNASSTLVKAFYLVWCNLPYFQEGMIGTGIYGLSRKARERFGEWPEIIADDGYIRAMFAKEQRKVCKDAKVVVFAPRNLKSLISTKTRSRLGRYQLAKMFPDMMRRERQEKNYFEAIRVFLLKPKLIFFLPVYLYVNLISRYRAKKQLKSMETYRWERDMSTR